MTPGQKLVEDLTNLAKHYIVTIVFYLQLFWPAGTCDGSSETQNQMINTCCFKLRIPVFPGRSKETDFEEEN